MNNWSTILNNARTSADIIAILRNVLAQLDSKSFTQIEELFKQTDLSATEKIAQLQLIIGDAQNLTAIEIINLQQAIQTAAAAGAGANGWLSSLVKLVGADQTLDAYLTDVQTRNVFLHQSAISAVNKNGSASWRMWNWQEAIIDCANYCAANGLTLTMPNGNLKYKGNIVFDCDVVAPQTRLVKTSAGTIKARANFEVRAIKTIDQLVISGDTSRGLEIESLVERTNIRVYEISGHGGDGCVLLKGNLANIWVKAIRNGGRGFVIASQADGDVRANKIYAETTRNCLLRTNTPQFEIEDYLTVGVFDNAKTAAYNTIRLVTQNNQNGPGYALRGRSQNISVYSEANTSAGILGASLDGSSINMLNHAVTTVTDLSNGSNEITSLFSGGNRTRTFAKLKKLIVSDPALTSDLNLEQTAARTFNLNATGSGSKSTLTIDSATVNLKYGALGLATPYLTTSTLSFGTIPAQSTIERTKELTGTFTIPAFYTISATPQAEPIVGIIWSCYLRKVDDVYSIVVRMHNTTNAAIVVPANVWALMIHGLTT